MIICLINRKRLMAFDPDPHTYKGITIGDIIEIPHEQALDHFNDLAVVTGFNIRYQIVHWKARSVYGGIGHSGTRFKDIIEHYKRYKG